MTVSDKTEENSMVAFTKSIGFILAGGYIVKLMSTNLLISGELHHGNIFTYVVGWLLVVFGVLYFLIIPFQSNSIFKSISIKLNLLSNILLPLLFVITFSQLISLISEISVIFTIIGSLIIAVIIAIGTICTLRKSLFNIHNLIYMSAVLAGFSTICILLSDFEKITLIKFSLGLCTILMLWAVYLMQKSGEKQ